MANVQTVQSGEIVQLARHFDEPYAGDGVRIHRLYDKKIIRVANPVLLPISAILRFSLSVGMLG